MSGLPAAIVIVGAGRVGSVVARCAQEVGVPVRVVRRGEAVPADAQGVEPVVVCTRAEHLADVLAVTPEARRGDLVLLQNGLLPPWLAQHGLDGPPHVVTQGIVWFAATARDGRAVPGAPCSFHGPDAAAVAALLRAGGIPARAIVDRGAFATEQAEKLGWNCIFGLLCELERAPVGVVLHRRDADVTALCRELAPVLADAYAAPVRADALEASVRAYTASIPDFVAGLKEVAWRNGAVQRAARAAGLPTQLHDRLLQQAIGQPGA